MVYVDGVITWQYVKDVAWNLSKGHQGTYIVPSAKPLPEKKL